MTFWTEFRKFIARGNLMDLAVGIMIGAAFNSIVQSFVKDILTPLIGVFLGKADVSKWSFDISGNTVMYGKFLQASLDFLILAIIVFTIVKFMAALKRKAEDESDVDVPTPKDIQLLSEIRDLLKSRI